MRKIALVFPGQGSQYVGMGKQLCEKHSIAEDIFVQANEILGFDLKKLCFDGDSAELTKTENAQPAIVTASFAAYKVYEQEIDMKPLFGAGHSLGEFSALAASGALSFESVLKLVRKRGEMMAQVSSGVMAAIMDLDYFIVERICQEINTAGSQVVVSNYNSPDQIVISGEKGAVEKVLEKIKDYEAKGMMLKVSGAFHSPLMEEIRTQFKKEVSAISFQTFNWPVISNVTGKPYENETGVADLLTRQLVMPVRWIETMEYMKENGAQIILEVGPGSVLKKLATKNYKYFSAFSMDQTEDFKAVKEEVENEWAHMPNLLGRALGIAVSTQNHNWDNEEYEKGVIQPYQRIKKLRMELEKEGKEPTIEQMKEAIEMLKSVFKTKKTPADEQIRRFHQLFDETRTRKFFPDFDFSPENN